MKKSIEYAVSACLCGVNCKYNGGNNYHEKLMEFLEGKDYVKVCPEVSGGLPVPRISCEITEGKVINREGQDVTEAFCLGAEKELKKIKDAGVRLVILQSRSPSCGKGIIYDGSFTGQKIPGNGIFVRKLKEAGIACMDVEEFVSSRTES